MIINICQLTIDRQKYKFLMNTDNKGYLNSRTNLDSLWVLQCIVKYIHNLRCGCYVHCIVLKRWFWKFWVIHQTHCCFPALNNEAGLTLNKGYFTSEATFRYDIVYIYKSKNCLDHLLQVNTTLLGNYYPPPLLWV